ncbi:hypothetical protein FOXB_06018 [Fusarium oxysporum f. sp. conglutinans Fo5176]|uniref:Uncharacterized protein n=1 Tax=Fusarium oxysporum (strain Fo5176) TaxID=660025 RepID=F9FHY9_FUSOF|nr:hypothetical protein FOXB_06018 [Fusarium oxysporum f. sp. conglutinans Fo5176]
MRAQVEQYTAQDGACGNEDEKQAMYLSGGLTTCTF